MAEFCLKCWNEINGANDPPRKYIISKDFDLCEGCGEWTHVIVMERKYFYLRKLRSSFFLFCVISAMLILSNGFLYWFDKSRL